jgi:hypothetical protein
MSANVAQKQKDRFAVNSSVLYLSHVMLAGQHVYACLRFLRLFPLYD